MTGSICPSHEGGELLLTDASNLRVELAIRGSLIMKEDYFDKAMSFQYLYEAGH